MPSSRDSLGARLLASLKFWLIVAVLCAVVAAVAFHVGRDYVGAHLHEMEVAQRAPQIQPQSTTAVALAGDEASREPPMKPVITLNEREPTAREERNARREVAHAQDGAQRNAARAAGRDSEAASDGEEADDDAAVEAEDSAGSRRGSFVVTAGAFADQVNAERQAQRLAAQGYQPYITTIEKDGVTYRRVNVGSFASREEADKLTEKLRSEGFDAAVGAGQG